MSIKESAYPSIALLMMVKNESKRILTTLSSVIGVVDGLIFYDTGSTDNTIELIKDFSAKNSLPLYYKTGEFVDFSTSRNVSLDLADEHPEFKYLLLLDGNDEVKNGKRLKKLAKEFENKPNSSFMLCQEWKNLDNSITKYYNVRFIKNNKGWRYKGSVHEYIANDNNNEYGVKADGVTIFQDRKFDAAKSMTRYAFDKELLLKDYEKNPEDGRTLFYLAQTYGCLDDLENCYEFYKKRVNAGGFLEEIFHSYLRLGEVGTRMGKPWNILLDHYICAFELLGRVEPLIKLTEYYRSQKMWRSAYMFAKKACDLEYPKNAVLFVDKNAYDYGRWHLLGIVAYYDEKYQDGYDACKKAIDHSNQEIDKNNLKFYCEKLKKRIKN